LRGERENEGEEGRKRGKEKESGAENNVEITHLLPPSTHPSPPHSPGPSVLLTEIH